jgi:hypothetical protein
MKNEERLLHLPLFPTVVATADESVVANAGQEQAEDVEEKEA